jgi:hypothetical protein
MHVLFNKWAIPIIAAEIRKILTHRSSDLKACCSTVLTSTWNTRNALGIHSLCLLSYTCTIPDEIAERSSKASFCFSSSLYYNSLGRTRIVESLHQIQPKLSSTLRPLQLLEMMSTLHKPCKTSLLPIRRFGQVRTNGHH